MLYNVATKYQQQHLPWGVPTGGEGSNACLLTQPEYITLYSSTLHIPLWSAYKLTKEVSLFTHILMTPFILGQCSSLYTYSTYFRV